MPCRRASSGLRKCTGWPSSSTSPSSGTVAPESALMSDDLPAPLSPITAMISPGSTSKSQPSRAVTGPYRLISPRACSTGAAVVGIESVDMMVAPRRGAVDIVPSLSAAAMRELVGGDGENHENPGDQDLVDGRYADQRQPVAEHADDQRAEQRADNRSASAEETRAAEHHRRDAVEILGLPRLGVADAGARHRQQRRDAVDRAGERIHGEQDALRRQAHQPRRFGVVAERVQMAAGHGFAQYEPDAEIQQERENRAVGHVGLPEAQRVT